LFSFETGTGPTGDNTSGAFGVDIGDLIRFYSDDLTITGQTGTTGANYTINFNLNQVQRYRAASYNGGTGIENPSEIGYATIRSLKLNSVDVVHTTSAAEELYTVTVPDDDELYYINILGETVNSSDLRFRFKFQTDPGFNTDIDDDAITPNFTISRHGNAGSPSDSGSSGTITAPPQIYRIQNIGGTGHNVDVVALAWPERWFMAAFSF